VFVDSHCHLQFNAYKDDLDEVIFRCNEKKMLLNTVGTQIDTSRKAVEMAEKYENIYATVGLHPVHISATEVDEEETKFTSREEEFSYEEYKKLAVHPKVIGIGECGLELFHLPANANREEILDKQKKGFVAQYKLAQEFNLPLVIHVRDAHDEMIGLLKSLGNKIKGVVHCYTSDWEHAQKYLDLGLYLGFTGIITFPPKKNKPEEQETLLEVVRNCPLDRMLAETDAPYLAPQAYRGKKCEPWMTIEVIKKIAEIKHVGLDEVNETIKNNTLVLFDKMGKKLVSI